MSYQCTFPFLKVSPKRCYMTVGGVFLLQMFFWEFFAANVWIVVVRQLPSASTNKCSIFVRTTSGILVLFWSLLVLVPPRHAIKKRRKSCLILKINNIYIDILCITLGIPELKSCTRANPVPPTHTAPTSSLSYRGFFLHEWDSIPLPYSSKIVRLEKWENGIVRSQGIPSENL